MDAVFHEKQQGSLCAQHCLNALLQGPYFTPVDLATLAQKLDVEERLRMAECGIDSEDYQRFLEQPSGNYDDSGYFSVQVISSALEVWELELIPYNSTEMRAIDAQKCPAMMNAFICNYRDHWFTIRRLGHQWFNLNSLLTRPELISDTYLAMFLAQLQQEGYSIFIVFGEFPECEADNLLRLVPAVQKQKPQLVLSMGQQVVANEADSDDDHELQRALRLSLGQVTEDVEDTPVASSSSADEEKEKQRRLLRLNKAPSSSSLDDDLDLQKALCLSLENRNQTMESSDNLDLEKALRMSLECCDSSTSLELNAEEVRQKRLNYLETRNNMASTSNERKVNT